MNNHLIKWSITIAVLLVLLVIATLISLSTGTFRISITDLQTILHDKSSIEYSVLTKIRLPRLILAFAVGGSLSMVGAVLQGIYRNPLVEPYTLGISGGAALGITIVIVMGLHLVYGAFVLPLFGFLGALITIFMVYFLSIKRGGLSINRMLLIGVMVSFIASSTMMFLMSISSTDNIHSIVFWIMGSLDEPNESLIQITFYSSLLGLAATYFFARPLNTLRLGEVSAKHLGVNSAFTIRVLFVVSSLLTGICVSVTGIIGFIGLIIPQLVKSIVGSDFRILLISSFLGGSIFLILCDVLARTIIAPNELPIGVITGIVGGAVFVAVLSKRTSKNN